MDGDLKGDIIKGSYSQLRISGITVDPASEDNRLALTRLENMAAEFSKRNASCGYQFENVPDINSKHGLLREYWHSFEAILAVRLMPDFGKGSTPDPRLLSESQAAYSFIFSSTAVVTPLTYPSRQPMGSGNRRYGTYHRRYYPPSVGIPNAETTAPAYRMYTGNIADFTEYFNAYLMSGEAISSYQTGAEPGLDIQSSGLASPNVSYQVKAVATTNVFPKLTIEITTSTGRVETRIKQFEVTSG